jgi:hypothetical protein
MAKSKKKSKLKEILEWVGIIGGGIAVLAVPVSVGLFINNKQHKMEMIELNQQHNLELQRQHDEFEEKISEIKNQLDDCKQQYRLLEIENRKGGYEKEGH